MYTVGFRFEFCLFINILQHLVEKPNEIRYEESEEVLASVENVIFHMDVEV